MKDWKYISPDDFIKETNNHVYDIDGSFGIQCVDGIKKHNLDITGNADFRCGNNWAYGLWTNYGTNGVEKYYERKDYKEARKGDWIIWNKDSKSCPKSHVGMFIEKLNNGFVKCYGQNQNGIKSFNFAEVSEDGILGVLRHKIYLGYHKGDSNELIYKVDEYLSEKVKGNYFGDYTEATLNVFKRKNGLPEDGIINKEVLKLMKIDE